MQGIRREAIRLDKRCNELTSVAKYTLRLRNIEILSIAVKQERSKEIKWWEDQVQNDGGTEDQRTMSAEKKRDVIQKRETAAMGH